VHNERGVFKKYEMAGSNKSGQEADPPRDCCVAGRSCSLVPQVVLWILTCFALKTNCNG